MDSLNNNISGVYVLKLEEDKWYVGSSKDISSRIVEHTSGSGSAWTVKYKYVSVYGIFPSNNLKLLEEDITYDFMYKYGIANVRGASFCSVNMSGEEYEAISKLLLHRQNKCIKCGEEGHYVNVCPNTNLGK